MRFIVVLLAAVVSAVQAAESKGAVAASHPTAKTATHGAKPVAVSTVANEAVNNSTTTTASNSTMPHNSTEPMSNTTMPMSNNTMPMSNSTTPMNPDMTMGNTTMPMGNGTMTMGNGTMTVGNGTVTMGNGTMTMGNGTMTMSQCFTAAQSCASAPMSAASDCSTKGDMMCVCKNVPLILNCGANCSDFVNAVNNNSYYQQLKPMCAKLGTSDGTATFDQLRSAFVILGLVFSAVALL